MATFTKPATTPRWADDLTNNLEPPEAKKDAGWLFQEIPPSNFENWKENLTGNWLKWVDERFGDGLTNDAIALLDPSGANAQPIVEVSGLVAGQSDFIFDDATFFSTLRVTKATQTLAWLAGAVESFAAHPTDFRIGPSDIDGVHVFGGGDIKGITFDTSFNQFRYRISTDTFGFYTNSATPSMEVATDRVRLYQPLMGVPQINIGSVAIPAATHSRFVNGLHVGGDASVLADGELFVENKIEINNANFCLELNGVDPMLSFDTDDTSIFYDVSAQTMSFNILGDPGFAIHPNSGNGTFVAATAFIPGNTGDFNTLRYESGARNAIQMQCKGSFLAGGSIIAGSRPWNVDSVERTGTGAFRIHPTQAIANNSCPMASIEGGGLLGRVIPFHNTNTYVSVTTISSASGTVADHQFNLIVTGA